MKIKSMTKITSILLVLVMCLMTLVGCALNIEMPDSTAPVTGNGGLAVQKGDYIYFVNGYQSAKDLKDGENKNGVNYSAIYRTKLGNNALSYDEDGNLQHVEIIVDKVCGFEKTALYIFGDYIYYATPNNEKVITSGELTNNFELTDFYRAKLDGSEKTFITRTTRASDNTKFAYYQLPQSGDVYLALFDGTSLYVINTKTNNKITVCENASSVALPTYTDYNPENNQISKGAQNVYYTRSGTEEENITSDGNVLCYAKIADGQEHVLAIDFYTYTVKFANNEALLLTKKGQYDYKAINYVFTYQYDQQGELDLDTQNGGEQLDASGNDNIILCTFENGVQKGFVFKNSSDKIAYINYQTGEYSVLDNSTKLTPLCIYGNYVYAYTSNNSIYKINYKDPTDKAVLLNLEPAETDEEANENEQANDEETQETGENKIAKPYFDAKKNVSIVNGSVYYFAEYKGDDKTGYYLNRISTIGENQTPELVGVVQDIHIETPEEE